MGVAGTTGLGVGLDVGLGVAGTTGLGVGFAVVGLGVAGTTGLGVGGGVGLGVAGTTGLGVGGGVVGATVSFLQLQISFVWPVESSLPWSVFSQMVVQIQSHAELTRANTLGVVPAPQLPGPQLTMPTWTSSPVLSGTRPGPPESNWQV